MEEEGQGVGGGTAAGKPGKAAGGEKQGRPSPEQGERRREDTGKLAASTFLKLGDLHCHRASESPRT